jgi:hypothetical protein
VRPGIARYVARVRPVLVRRAFDSGQHSVPAAQAGIAQILSWTRTMASTHAISTIDRTTVRSIGRASHYFRENDKLSNGADCAGLRGLHSRLRKSRKSRYHGSNVIPRRAPS